MHAIPAGRDPRSSYSRHVTTRLLDFTRQGAPWPIRLWDVGSFLALEELYEAGVWVDRRVLSQPAVDWQRHALERLLGDDPALGSSVYRRELREVLQTTLTLASDGRRKLRHLIDVGRPGYLGRWSSCAAAQEPPRAERVARAVAAHLLDSGHSLAGVQRWLRSGHLSLSATDLIAEASALLARPPRQWRVVVPFRSLSRHEELAGWLPNWLTAEQTRPLMAGASAERHREVVGGLSYSVEARDAERAVEIVSDLVERLQARARFTAAGAVVPLGEAYIGGEDRSFPLLLPSRGAQVLSLAAERQLYVVGQDVQRFGEQARSTVDEALEIASALNQGPLAPAIAGGWAALESLLTEARDPDEREKVVAASRAAALVACSWPRAELTALSYRVREVPGDALPGKLSACASNRERSTLIAAELECRDGLPLVRSWRTGSDVASVFRMKALLADRRRVLERVRGYLEVSLRRLYRCRNIVLHGGSTGGVALPATLRVTAPLVGAALDRIAHSHLVAEVPPLALASRAETALRMVDDDLGPGLCDLID
ncbi:integrase [Microbispora sp. NEAU-D428]|uniref:integrase n=1 Tax=Microbispora sitophila TaxID=2771537 RepID=UPI001866A2B0|nr:integrase [Microbispora sitophila]MBE3014744.1 integrase [Microbispora sitophila]